MSESENRSKRPAVPTGGRFGGRLPSSELLGYFQPSLRDDDLHASMRETAVLRALPILTTLFACAALQAQERQERPTIKVGESMTAALAVLRDRRIECHQGGLAITKGDDDSDYFVCYPDENRTSVVLFYPKSGQTIRGMVAITKPHLRSGRSEHIWTDIRSLTLGKDGSYSIEFLPT